MEDNETKVSHESACCLAVVWASSRNSVSLRGVKSSTVASWQLVKWQCYGFAAVLSTANVV